MKGSNLKFDRIRYKLSVKGATADKEAGAMAKAQRSILLIPSVSDRSSTFQ